MLNSILILGSTYEKSRKINIIFAIAWLIFMVMGSNLATGLIFTIINVLAFATVFAIGMLLKGKYSNILISIFSILIWSILIDTLCYFIYPEFAMGQNFLTYISNGIAFNYRYVVYNAVIVAGILCIKNMLLLRLKPIKET